MYTLVVIGDENDADYVSRVSQIGEKEAKLVRKVADVLRQSPNREHNWNTGSNYDPDEDPVFIYENLLTEDDIEEFSQYVPGSEYRIHSISNIILINDIKDDVVLFK